MSRKNSQVTTQYTLRGAREAKDEGLSRDGLAQKTTLNLSALLKSSTITPSKGEKRAEGGTERIPAMNWRFLVLVLVFGGLLLLGARYFILSRMKSDEYHQCPHCRSFYRGEVTYCPHCGQVVSRWSNRR
jgi:hypothetical protein